MLICKKTGDRSSDNEWQRVTTSDNEWQLMTKCQKYGIFYAKFKCLRDKDFIPNSELSWIFNLTFSYYIYIVSMKGINRSYAICIKQKRSPRGVLQKSYFGKFCKILAKKLSESPY